MKRILSGLLLLMFLSVALNAQNEKVIKPILMDKSVLSGVGLDKIDLKDEPEKDFHQKRLYRGEDISVYVVSTETWNNRMDNFPFDEFIYMLHGEALVKPDQGPSQLFYSGDYFFAPRGYTGEWEIRAGSNLHYELSVIATQRADSTKVSKDSNHQLFSRSKISGAHIELDEKGQYSELLQHGIELTVRLKAEKPAAYTVLNPAKEKMIHVLSGQITITDKENISETFYTGDFWVMPKGFTGKWKSEGHGLVKFLSIEKTDN